MEKQGLRESFWETDLFGSQIVKMHKNHFLRVDIFFTNSSSLVHHQFCSFHTQKYASIC